MTSRTLSRPELRLKIVENKAETLSIAIRRRGEIFLKLSRASNNRCRFCNDAPFQDGSHWPFEALCSMIDQGIAQGVRKVFLSGGEPTLHPRFLEVIAYARRRGAERVTCITNGRLFAYPELAAKASRLGLSEAFVAVLGKDAETHDWLTQVPGSFEQTTAGVRNLLAQGVRVHLSTVVTKKNLAQLSHILRLIPGVTGLTAVRVAPAGRALFESLDLLGFEVEEARPHIEQATRVASELALEFRPKLFPASFYEGREADYTHHEEYLPEIKDTELRTGLFGRYARGEGDIHCRGETCRVCFRRPFCDALYAFRERLVTGAHPVVRCDLDDERQRGLLPRLLAGRRLWVRARSADTVGPALAALGVETPPFVVQAEELGGADAPACEHLVLGPGSRVGSAAALARARRVGIVARAPASIDPPLLEAASFVLVEPEERHKDELARGAPGPDVGTERDLPVAGLPLCLAARQFELAAPEDILDLVAVASPTEVDVVGYTHHFLKNLHRERSTRCAGCVEEARCAGLHVNHARRWGFAVLDREAARAAAYERDARPAPAEDFSANFERLAERFRALAAERPLRGAMPVTSPEAERALAAMCAVDPALVCIDAPDRDELGRRARRAIGVAHALAGDAGIRALANGVVAAARRLASGRLLHGTGSWALDRILEDGVIRPGGDGLTGEVALTHFRSSDLYVCLSGGPASLYAAAAFAYMNCGDDGARLGLSAVRADGAPIGELFSVLTFGESHASLAGEMALLAATLTRHRTLAMEETFLGAANRALDLARRGALVGDGREHARRLGAPADAEVAFGNMLLAVVERMRVDPAVMALPKVDQLAAGVLKYMPGVRSELVCPLPEDDAATKAKKLAVLDALRAQHPVILEIDERRAELRPGPTDAYSPERMVPHAIPTSAILVVHAPLAEVAEVEEKLRTRGLGAAVVPLEDFEAVRLLSEAMYDRPA